MAYDRFLIAPFQSGLQNNMRPWLIPDDAFEELQNAYVFRGRVRKRFGSRYMGSTGAATNLNQLNSRLRISLGVIGAGGTLAGNVPGTKYKLGQQFSVVADIFTVQALGNPVDMLSTGGVATVKTYDTATGAYSFAGLTPATEVFFYPSEPVMGLSIYESGPASNQPSYAFDTQFAYTYTGNAWARSLTGAIPLWHGSNLNYFWTENYRDAATGETAFFVTNFYATNPSGVVTINDDPIYYLFNGAWTAFTPTFLVAGNKVLTARLIVQFKDRLVLLNTIEVNAAGTNNTSHVNRARFSAASNPTTAAAFLESTQIGEIGGSFVDAPTAEAIITAGFVKDRLIVYFERSTYELAYVNNGLVPFEWNKLDDELGSESTFSAIGFNQEILAIGNTGIHSCTGSTVSRIDDSIPDKIFQVKNSDEFPKRVAGIRDYYTETVYWSYPQSNQSVNSNFSDKVLVYNYKNKTWAENDDCINTFGYYEQGDAPTWASLTDITWETWLDPWNSGASQSLTREVIAGNQQGFTFIIDQTARNGAVMQLSNATLANNILTLTILDHNLQQGNSPTTGDYISIEYAQGATNLNTLIYRVNRTVDKDTVEIVMPSTFTLGGVYTGAGCVSRISNIKIKSKQWNPYDKDGSNMFLAKIDFGVQKTTNGEITVDYFPSSSEYSMIGANNLAPIGNSILETKPYSPTFYPMEAFQERLWHPVYFQSYGESIQLFMSFNDTQMRSKAIVWSDFEIDGMVLYTSKAGSRLE